MTYKGFTATPLTEIGQKVELEQDTRETGLLKRALKRNLTAVFFNDMKHRRDKGLNAVLGSYGPPGVGKSTVLLFVFWCLDVIYNINFAWKLKNLPHVEGNRMRMRTVLAKAKPFSSYLLDEAKHRQHGTGSKRVNDDLSNIIDEALRGNSIFFGHASPELDDTIPHHYVFRPYKMNEKLRLTMSVVYQPNDKSKLIPTGHIITGMPPKELIENYLKKKKQNMTNVQKGTDDTRMKEWKKWANKLIKSPEWYYADDPSSKKLVVNEMVPSSFTENEKKFIMQMALKMEAEAEDE